MIHVVVGLGNPGSAYQQTRHNLGFLILDHLAREEGASWKKQNRWQSEVASFTWEIEDRAQNIYLVKPQTFMNLSGVAVQSFLEWYHFSIEDMLVVADDVVLPLGQLRLRAGGSSGGHNGLKSIENQLQTQNFARLRCGIGPLPPQQGLADFVLEKFSSLESLAVQEMVKKGSKAIKCACILGLAKAMNQFNQLKP